MRQHPEILMVKLGNEFSGKKSKLTSTGLKRILSLPSLSSLKVGKSIEFISGINVNIASKQLQTLQLNCDNGTLNDDWFIQILEQCGSTLKTLTLKSSIITGEILIKFKGTLPCLEILELISCKQLTNKGLLQIIKLCGSTLRSLDIQGTNITGENLSEFKGTLPCLENLNLRVCKQLTDYGLMQFLQLCGSTLKSLNLSETNITGENLPEFKGTLPCLENLEMGSCEQLTNKGMLYILELCGSKLRYLNISGTEITGENMSGYKVKLPCLEKMNMRVCKQLTDYGLMKFLQLCGSTLKSLNLSETNITGENLTEFKGTLPCLENLNLRVCKLLTDYGLMQFLQLCGSTLKSLDLSETNITGENLPEFKGTLPCLENLNLISCKQLTDNGLLLILQLCGSTLRSLDIQYANITGENLSEFKGNLPCLENLNFGCCRQLTENGLLQFLKVCGSTLTSLDIEDTNITGENLSDYMITLPYLENLNLLYCEQLTDKGLLQILQLCGITLRFLNISETNITGENLSEYKGILPCLENLNIRSSRLTNSNLLQILQLCGSSLRSLDISETNISGENMSEFKGTLPCLEYLYLSNCRQLTNNGLQQILQLCGSSLRVLDLSETDISGENLSDYKGHLPCLEYLSMCDCRQLTDKGLLQILQVYGSTLRDLDIADSNATGDILSEYSHISF